VNLHKGQGWSGSTGLLFRLVFYPSCELHSSLFDLARFVFVSGGNRSSLCLKDDLYHKSKRYRALRMDMAHTANISRDGLSVYVHSNPAKTARVNMLLLSRLVLPVFLANISGRRDCNLKWFSEEYTTRILLLSFFVYLSRSRAGYLPGSN
jgi:hypothetical protein